MKKGSKDMLPSFSPFVESNRQRYRADPQTDDSPCGSRIHTARLTVMLHYLLACRKPYCHAARLAHLQCPCLCTACAAPYHLSNNPNTGLPSKLLISLIEIDNSTSRFTESQLDVWFDNEKTEFGSILQKSSLGGQDQPNTADFCTYTLPTPVLSCDTTLFVSRNRRGTGARAVPEVGSIFGMSSGNPQR